VRGTELTAPTSPCLRASVVNPAVNDAAESGIRWLINLQNRDGGFPTFCRGWGTLPFDRSSPDITAHCLRAIWSQIGPHPASGTIEEYYAGDELHYRGYLALTRGFNFLQRVQRSNGSWLPLWFGNQYLPDDENPVYGTSRVLRALRDCDLWNDHARRGAEWLRSIQNSDGGWGGDRGTPSTVEETALALDALLDDLQGDADPVWRGVSWLLSQVEDGTWNSPSPIGFYFAKLWYFEALYPVVWTVAALRKAEKQLKRLAPNSLG